MLILAALWLAASSVAGAASQPSYHFTLQRYQGATMIYLLTTTGTLDIITENDQPVTRSFELSTLIDLSFAAEPSGDELPFQLTMRSPVVRGLDEPGPKPLDPVTLSGRLDLAGALRSIETPPFLAELGIDMTDLIIGLVVPAPVPSREVTPGTEWQVTLARGPVARESARDLDLTVTYIAGREVDWGSRPLLTVTGRLRADATLREVALRTDIQEIGHALLYLQPATGIPELSSLSVITQVETRPSFGRTIISRAKTTLTTTLELREIQRAAGALPPAGEGEEPAPAALEPAVPSGPAAPQEGVVPVHEEAAPVGEPSLPQPDLGPPEPEQGPAEAPGDQEAGQALEQELSEPQEPVPDAEALEVSPEIEVLDESVESVPDEAVAAEPEQPEIPSAAAAVYTDPAGRFQLGLGPEWVSEPRSISLRGTTFVSHDGKERAYVYVMPLPSPAATALAIARSTLATYGETQTNFRVLSEPEPDLLDGETAYRAHYIYTLGDETITEWALFARMRDRAYYLQYARSGDFSAESEAGWEKLYALRDHFRFGEDPRGWVPVERLEESLTLYVDPQGTFSLQVPSLWPRTERAADGSSTIFTEIGERGHLTILVQPGASGFTAQQIVTAWKEQLAQEEGFTILVDVTPQVLGGHQGVWMEYSWTEGASGQWRRRLHAAVVDDTFLAVAIDYEAPHFQERAPVFDAMIQSLTILPQGDRAPETLEQESLPPPAPSTESQAPPVSPDTELEEEGLEEMEEPAPGDAEDAKTEEPASTAPAPVAPESSPAPADRVAVVPVPREAYPFPEPDDEEGVILLGRILTRYPGPDGAMVEEWASNLQVTVLAGQDEYTGVTDERGYVYVANLPRLSQGRLYTVTRLDGPMLGFVEPVAVSFDNLRIGTIGPRVAHLRTIILTLHADRSLTVNIVRTPESAAEEPSALEYFVAAFPESAWTEHVREVILSGLD